MTRADEVQSCRWHPVADLPSLDRAASARIVAAAERAIGARGRFDIVLAGGNTPAGAYRLLRAAPAELAEWSRWHVYFGDERCLPATDAGRNSSMAAQCWLDHVAIPAANRHPMGAEAGASEAAARYVATLRAVGEFDVVLLGLGEDGHTASLFPGHPWGTSGGSATVLPVFGAPKPPPQRVSMSAARLSDAREVIFLVAGDDKRDAVAQWRAGAPIPASAIAPPGGVDVIIEAALLASPTGLRG